MTEQEEIKQYMVVQQCSILDPIPDEYILSGGPKFRSVK